MKDYKLYIFDVDGTLVRPKSGGEFRKTADDWQWLPGRLERLKQLKADGKFIRFATNQGGVAFDYLKEHEVQNEFTNMSAEIGYPRWKNITHVCFTHPKSTIGKYAGPNDNRRKPGSGMLLEAMRHEDVKPEETIMIGDRPEDEQAAKNCGCDFMWADDFFKDQDTAEDISPEGDIIMHMDPAVRNAYEEEIVNPSPQRTKDEGGPAIMI